jgi:hypothetical protein
MERCPSGLRCTPGTRVWIYSPSRVRIPPSPHIFMQDLKHILLLLLSAVIFSDEIDTLSVNVHEIDNKSILIPDYDTDDLMFKIEYLDKRKKFFLDMNLSYLNEQNSLIINFSPILNYKRFKFKMNIDYLFSSDSSNYNNSWDTLFDVVERIEYLECLFYESRIKLYLGEINNLSFGHGYLLNNYNNSYKFPSVRNLGLKFNYSNSTNTFTYELFFSSLRDLSDNGGLVGNRVSFLYSKNFPLRFGFGHIIDLNQFLSYKDSVQNINREVNAFEIDFSFPLVNFINDKIFLIGEVSAIDYPEKRYYKRVDDSEFTNDKKSRTGVWGLAFPGFVYINKSLEFSLIANYNSAIYSPYYFNSTYDLEKVRYRHYNILENEILYQDEAELLQSFSTTDSTIFIPKDMYGMINEAENTYPTYGFSSSIKYKIDKKNKIDLAYSYFKNISDIDNSFYNTISINYLMNKKIIFFPTKLRVYFSKNFFKITESYKNDENLIYGLDLDMTIYESLSLKSQFKHTFYDINFDGKIDLVPYVSIGLNYKY